MITFVLGDTSHPLHKQMESIFKKLNGESRENKHQTGHQKGNRTAEKTGRGRKVSVR